MRFITHVCIVQFFLAFEPQYCYDVKTGEVRVGGLDRFEEVELANPDTWCVCGSE